MSSIQLPLAPQKHANQQLFSDYYLDNTLPKRPDWNALEAEAAAMLPTIKQLFDQYVPSNNEAQLENDVIRPVLDALGHTFALQVSLRTPDGTKKPDYVLFNDEPTATALRTQVLDDALLAGKAIAVADAKAWDRALDQAMRVGSDPFSNKNPSYQIAFYIQHSGLDWGILTNGRMWRLYHRDSAHKLDRFYAVNLPELLDDPQRFLYFYAFFRRAAFDQTASLNLNDILNQSRTYARQVSDSIKLQVYTALRHVAQGFLDVPANRFDRNDPATLRQIYDGSLIVLYRLLFLLYAEARELLPVRSNASYAQNYSLHAIKHEIAQHFDRGTHLLANSSSYWGRLRDLFEFIDQGSPPLDIATFNGGLFDPAEHPFLEQKRVGDAHLMQAIDLLTRVDREFVDYRDLAERHLGTIYEGLLEFQLQPLAQPDGGFSLDLLNDKGERKASGSYYTPDYIVQYMIEQTIKPAALAAIANATSDQAKINAILRLNVLDPAMGSGHFLVSATEYLAQFLVDLGVQSDEHHNDEADIAFWRRQVAQSCIYGVDLNPLAVDLAKLSLWLVTVAKDKPLSFLDHHLRVGNALVGATLDNLRPRVRRTRNQVNTNQASMLDDSDMRRSLGIAVDSMFLIEGSAADSVQAVKEQERMYQQLRHDLTDKYGRLANLATAQYFGVEFDPNLWDTLADVALERRNDVPQPLRDMVQQAQAIAAERWFFHWELEFPEIFFDKHGASLGEQAGFDVVLGNPPYVRQEQISAIKPFLAEQYTTYHGVADLYVYFFEQGIKKLRDNGYFSFISSNKFMRANYGAPLRGLLTTNTAIQDIVDFGELPVFNEAATFPAILVARKRSATTQQVRISKIKHLRFSDLAREVERANYQVGMASLADGGWSLANNDVANVLAQIHATSVSLGDYIGNKLYRGILTGYNEAFYLDQATRDALIHADQRSAELIKPLVVGDDVRRYQIERKQRYLIFIRRGININDYPAIKQHLNQFRQRLEPKPANHAGEWHGRKAGSYQWYEIQDTVDYFRYFEQPKIVYPEIGKEPRFTIDTEKLYPNNKCFIIAREDYYLLALLNSRLLFAIAKTMVSVLGDEDAGGRLELRAVHIQHLPIRRINFVTEASERAKHVSNLWLMYTSNQHEALLTRINAMLDPADDHSDVVHDLVAQLAQAMLNLHKQRNEQRENLMLDLEGILSNDELGKIQRLWTPPKASNAEAERELGALAQRKLDLRDDFAQLTEAQWKWLIKQRLKTVPSMSGMVQIYRQHQPMLAQLDHTITRTDTLIDQIVYRLYNLSDDDIRVIEN